jgi:hypothetical protein
MVRKISRSMREEVLPLDRLAGGETERAHGAPVEAVQESDETSPLGVIAGKLGPRLDGFCAAVAKEDHRVIVEGGNRAQALGQLDLRQVVKVGAGHVDELLGLVLDSAHHARVRVAGGIHGDAGREVEETVAVYIPHVRAFAALHDEGIAACIGRRDHRRVTLDQGFRVRTGEDPGHTGHTDSPEKRCSGFPPAERA